MEDVICSMCGPGVPCSCGKVKDNPTVKSSLYEGYPPILGTIGIPNMKVDNKLKAIELAIEFGKLLSVQTHVIEVSVEQLEFVIKENFEVFVGEDDWQLFGVWIDNVDGVASLMFQLNLWGE